jgi:aminotransferase
LELLEEARVAVVPGIAFGPSGEGHLRLSFGRSEEDINKAFDRIEKHFKG